MNDFTFILLFLVHHFVIVIVLSSLSLSLSVILLIVNLLFGDGGMIGVDEGGWMEVMDMMGVCKRQGGEFGSLGGRRY